MDLYKPETDLSFLETLNGKQREAVECPGGPLLILAGAGTGKTKTLTSKIARLIAGGTAPYKILAVTFTNKAAHEMKERIENLMPGRGSKVYVHTFHSFGLRMLRRHYQEAKLPKDFVIYDESDQRKVLTEVLNELNRKDDVKKIALYLNLISRAKDDLLDAESYAINAGASASEHRLPVAEVYTAYQRKLDLAGALDFGDLLLKTCNLLKHNEILCKQYQDFFEHILVDEYQDTNHTQYVLVKTLAAKHKNLCVVGDPDQSIYSWRGADIRNILDFEKDFPQARTISLEENYRSTANILNAADSVIKNNLNRKEKNLYTSKGSGEKVTVKELLHETAEANWVALQIKQLIDEGYSYKDIAVFYRTNAQSRSFETAFAAYQIPHKLIGAVKFFERKEIKDALAYVKVLVNPFDGVSLGRILNVPARGIGATAQEHIKAYAAQKGISFYEALMQVAFIEEVKPMARRAVNDFINLTENLRLEIKQGVTASLLMQRILALTGYWKSIENEIEDKNLEEDKARLDNLQGLINSIKEYEEKTKQAGEQPSLSGYLQDVSLVSGADDDHANTGGVTLMTIHLAKGLEFPVVFLTGLEEGLFPISSGRTSPEDMEEERRICYVGMTRAQKKLFLTHASTRRVFGQTNSNLASRFLYETGLMVKETRFMPSDNIDFLKPKAKPQAAPSLREKKAGQRVRHAVYGTGRILSDSGSGDKKKITVLFDGGTRMTFMAMYAPLEML